MSLPAPSGLCEIMCLSERALVLGSID